MQGRFEIISLSGAMQQSESNGERSRTCTLNVTLAGSDGRVLGGGVAGTLTAASTVQVSLSNGIKFMWILVLYIYSLAHYYFQNFDALFMWNIFH